MGDIWRPYDSGIGDPDPGTSILCVNGRDLIIHELWCRGISGLYREGHPTVRIDIPGGSIGEFVT